MVATQIAEPSCERDRLSLDKQIQVKQAEIAAVLQSAEHALAAAESETDRKRAAKTVALYNEKRDRLAAFVALQGVRYAYKGNKTIAKIVELRFSPGGLPEVAIARMSGGQESTVPETLTPWRPVPGERVFEELDPPTCVKAQIVEIGGDRCLAWMPDYRTVQQVKLEALHPVDAGFDLNLEKGDRVLFQGQAGTVENAGAKIAILLDSGDTIKADPNSLALSWIPSEKVSIPDDDPQEEIKAAAERIRVRLKRTTEDIIEIGRDMLRVKELLGHGQFQDWLNREFELSESAAQKFMQCARQFEGKTVNFTDLKPSALYLLSSPSTPEVVREEAIARAEAGNPMKIREIKEAIAEAKAVEPEVETLQRSSGRDFPSVKEEQRAIARNLGIPVNGLPDNSDRDREQHDFLEQRGEQSPPNPYAFLPAQLKRAIFDLLTPSALSGMGDGDRVKVAIVLEEARKCLEYQEAG